MLIAALLTPLGLIGFAVVILGLVSPNKSQTLAVIALAMAALWAFGAYYSWTQAQPMAVVILLGLSAAVALLSARRQFSR